MEPIKFLMTDTGAGCTAACKAALEAKGVEVHVCEKNGAAALDALRPSGPRRCCWTPSCPSWTPSR